MKYKPCNHELVEENGFVYCSKCGLEISRIFVVERGKRDLEIDEADRISLIEYLFDKSIEVNGI